MACVTIKYHLNTTVWTSGEVWLVPRMAQVFLKKAISGGLCRGFCFSFVLFQFTNKTFLKFLDLCIRIYIFSNVDKFS